MIIIQYKTHRQADSKLIFNFNKTPLKRILIFAVNLIIYSNNIRFNILPCIIFPNPSE